MSNTALMPRATIDQIEAQRNESIAQYAQVFDLLEKARKLQPGSSASPFLALGSQWGKSKGYSGAESRHEFLLKVRQDLDRGIWDLVLSTTKLETLMDHTAREQFRTQLAENPPEATANNIYATLHQFTVDAGDIFKRGVATAFASLDRRFRSHDGFKLGARIIISYALRSWGGIEGTAQNRIRDVERAFLVLDGKSPPERYAGSVVGLIDAASQGSGLKVQPFTLEDDYFKVRGFKNLCIHIWFKRDDLIDRVNLLLADYYGEALAAGCDAADKGHRRTTAVAKNMGFFPTPETVALELLQQAGVATKATYSGEYPRLDILEPSAGTGSISAIASGAGHRVTCIELHPGRASELAACGKYRATHQGDFLEMSPEAIGKFDRVLMNPPFDQGLDMDHVRHAFGFLKPGGTLSAIMSAGTAYREDARTENFRQWAERFKGSSWGQVFQDLPPGSFKASGTMVNACILTIHAPS